MALKFLTAIMVLLLALACPQNQTQGLTAESQLCKQYLPQIQAAIALVLSSSLNQSSALGLPTDFSVDSPVFSTKGWWGKISVILPRHPDDDFGPIDIRGLDATISDLRINCDFPSGPLGTIAVSLKKGFNVTAGYKGEMLSTPVEGKLTIATNQIATVTSPFSFQIAGSPKPTVSLVFSPDPKAKTVTIQNDFTYVATGPSSTINAVVERVLINNPEIGMAFIPMLNSKAEEALSQTTLSLIIDPSNLRQISVQVVLPFGQGTKTYDIKI